jgi:hypothetical protein
LIEAGRRGKVPGQTIVISTRHLAAFDLRIAAPVPLAKRKATRTVI